MTPRFDFDKIFHEVIRGVERTRRTTSLEGVKVEHNTTYYISSPPA